jgi:DNA-binding PadR family transcriptional regulator
MTSLFRFSPHGGKERSLLALYVLHTLRKSPKSGYDLIKEIEEKTGGTWSPSKGTIYPLLRKLHEDEMIEVVATEERAKTLYVTTQKGETTLDTIREKAKEHHRKMGHFKNLLLSVFGASKHSVQGLLFNIREVLEEMPPGTEKQVIAVLEECRENLRRI